jgi:hypothetical protein
MSMGRGHSEHLCEWCEWAGLRRRATQTFGTDFTPLCERCADAERPSVMWRVRARKLLQGRTDARSKKLLREIEAA